MEIIKWFSDKWNKPEEPKEPENAKCPDCGASAGHFSTCTGSTIEPLVFDNDAARVEHYRASGGEIIDLSNKERLPNDGFASDHELMQPWNQAHTGTKRGLASLAKGDRR